MKTLKDYVYGAGILDASNPYIRVLRRAVIMGAIAFVAEAITGYQGQVSPLYFPLVVALGAAIDKGLRELL